MENTTKNINQLEYEARNRAIYNEFRQRQHDALTDYDKERLQLGKELAKVQSKYYQRRNDADAMLDKVIDERRQLKKNGQSELSSAMQANYDAERTIQRQLRDLKENYQQATNNIKERMNLKRMAYNQLSNINARWKEQQLTENRKQFMELLSQTV